MTKRSISAAPSYKSVVKNVNQIKRIKSLEREIYKLSPGGACCESPAYKIKADKAAVSDSSFGLITIFNTNGILSDCQWTACRKCENYICCAEKIFWKGNIFRGQLCDVRQTSLQFGYCSICLCLIRENIALGDKKGLMEIEKPKIPKDLRAVQGGQMSGWACCPAKEHKDADAFPESFLGRFSTCQSKVMFSLKKVFLNLFSKNMSHFWENTVIV